jgi:hypothetical protein
MSILKGQVTNVRLLSRSWKSQVLWGSSREKPSVCDNSDKDEVNCAYSPVVITGTSSGIGVETARALYEAGATLFLTARDLPKLDKVIDDIVINARHNKDGPRPEPVAMHLDSLDSVRKGAEEFMQKSGGKLNILISMFRKCGTISRQD